MLEFYECKASYKKQEAQGKLVPQKPVYLVETVTFGDAERRTLEAVAPYAFGGEDITITSIKKVKYAEVQHNEAGFFWFKVKVQMEIVDEEKGKTKRVTLFYLLREKTMEDAYRTTAKMLEASPYDAQILNIKQTDIIEVLH